MQSFRPARRALLCGLAGAAVLATFAARAAATGNDAARLIGNLAENTIAIVGNRGLSRVDRAERLREVIDRGFDTDAIGRLVLGRHWQAADAGKRAEFIELFRDYTALTYARRFEAYAGQKLAIVGTRAVGENGDKMLVQSQMKNPDGATVKIDWRLHDSGDGWRIYDVVVEGVSMVLTQRSEFASVIDRNGGKLQPLIDQLRTQMDKLA